MSELEYYESRAYREFLLSQRRKEICDPEVIFNEIKINGAENILDFGIGNGFYLNEMKKRIKPETWIWGAECQQDLIDELLQKKLKEKIANFTPFFIEKSDHPILPEWVPKPDLAFSSLCLSTFPNPGLAMDGIFQSMVRGGTLIVVDWAKVEHPDGPKVKDKVSIDKMKFLADDFNIDVVKSRRISEFFYIMELRAGKNFEYGHYNLNEENSESSYTL